MTVVEMEGDKQLRDGISRIKYCRKEHVPEDQREQGWCEFLEKYGLWDCRMQDGDLYDRYLRFKNVTFGEMPQEEWKQCFAELLPMERGLVFGDAIGRVDEFEFTFEVRDRSIIREKAIPYSRPEREWIRTYMQKLCELGVVRQVMPGDPDPRFVVGAVLVKEGQSQ